MLNFDTHNCCKRIMEYFSHQTAITCTRGADRISDVLQFRLTILVTFHNSMSTLLSSNAYEMLFNKIWLLFVCMSSNSA